MQYVVRYGKIALGNLIMVLAYALINVPKGILNGGVTSFSMILSRVTGWDISWFVNGTMLFLLLLCLIFLGRSCFFGVLFGGICYSQLFALINSFGWELPLPLLASIPLSAALVGLGYYLCISAGATALGFDTIAIILNRYFPRIRVAPTMGLINVLMLLFGLAVYGWISVIAGVAFSALHALFLDLLLRLEERHKRKKTESAPCP